ncbi:hypothetical protein [Phytohabitans rumicis]|uniref:hypothetical protein n=1 Tax=Phytohabitans rumicis TaxID=1076125 RepID=UPI00156771E3|nr:hypothetical protein [Phytohabitans rumicis]
MSTRFRIAWLLRSLRRHAQDPVLRNGRRFAAAFPSGIEGEVAGGINPSQVTRWETGQTPVTYRVLRGYERLLGLGRRSLVTLVDSTVRFEQGVIGAPPLGRPAVPDEAVRQRRLLDLVERADSPAPMHSRDWDDLTALLSGWRYPCLRDRDWEQLTGRLATELYVSEGHAWLRRQEALFRLLGHPSGGRIAIATCAGLLADPTNPGCGDILLTLDGVREESASGLVLRQFQAASGGEAQHRAAVVSLQKLKLGHFRGRHLDTLVTHATELVTLPQLHGTLRVMAAELLRIVPHPHRAAREQLRRAADAHRSVAAVSRTGRLHASRAAATVPDGDPVLGALVEDLLHQPDVSRRFFAAQWLALSPYGRPLGRQLAAELRRPEVMRDEVTAPVHLEALTILGSPAERPLGERLLVSPGLPASVRVSAARALTHMPGRSADAFWRRALAHHRAAWHRMPSPGVAAVLDHLVYAAGSTQNHGMLRDVAADPSLPATMRSVARWWCRHPDLAPAGVET